MEPRYSFEESLKETDGLVDSQMGIRVEPKIKRLVAALRMFGVRTIQSCEGHLDERGLSTPFVQVEAKDLVPLMELVTHFNRHDRDDRTNHHYWAVSPMPFGLTLQPSALHQPLEELQREAEEFAQALIRLAGD